MECELNRTPCKRRLDNYSGHEHLTASKQPMKYSEDTLRMEFGRTRRDAFRSTRKPAVLDYEERGLSDPKPRDCVHGVHILV
jgi:hypothetical protein